MTAFSLVMLGKLVFRVVFVCFLLLLCLYDFSLFLIKTIYILFRLLCQMSTSRPELFHFGKVALAKRCQHNDWLMWLYDLMFANYYESKFAWRLTLSLDLFSCYLNSSAQRRLPDFTASTRLSDKFKMADAADDAMATQFSKCQEEYSIEDVDRLAFLRIMTSSRSRGCCRSKTWRITSRIGACQACLHLMFMFTDVCTCEIHHREVTEACRCACPDGIAPSKVSTSNDACDDHFLISAKSETLLSRPLSASMYTNFA